MGFYSRTYGVGGNEKCSLRQKLERKNHRFYGFARAVVFKVRAHELLQRTI